MSSQSEADFEKLKGTLKGKVVLSMPMREVKAALEPLADRYTDAELAELAQQPNPAAAGRSYPRGAMEFARKRAAFFRDEGVVAVLEPGQGDGGTVFVGRGGWRKPADAPVPLEVVVRDCR